MGTKFQGSESEIRALNAWIKMKRASNSIQTYINRSLENSGVTITQFGTMEILFHLGPLPQKSISKKMLCSPGNITLVIDNLEKAGFVERKGNPNDRRYHLIHLTKPGEKHLKGLLKNHVENIHTAFSILSDDDQLKFSSFCEKLGKYCETKKEKNK
ncbi:MAG: MarR family winged helix-turn-helix transcriptional regulator [Fidelibacterota bacterium]